MTDRLRLRVRETSLGWAGIVVSDAGVRAVELADHESQVCESLHERFGELRSTDVEPRDSALVDAAIEVLEGGGADVRLDQRGTEFQLHVWQALCRIPAGETRSYADLAEDLDRPTAARAVARACATNEIAVLVPCHRVVRSDGALSGYRWGVERKRALLERERG